MKKLISIVASALCVAVVAAKPSFTMRIDDNKSPADWRRVAGIFEKRGMRVSFAVNPAGLTEEQGACLRELSGRGHLVMDHTPNHTFYRAKYHDRVAFDRAKGKSFVHEVDEKGQTLYFKCMVDDAHPRNRRAKASVRKNVIAFADPAMEQRAFYTFVKLPGRTEVFGVLKNGEAKELRDFWRRELKETIDVPECEVIVYDHEALQPCDDVLRELASISRERFDHFKLPRPTIWVRPGGWDPGIHWKSLERVYGGEFGYVGADSAVGAARGANRWTTGYDAMYFFDQGAEITPDQLVDAIQKRIGSGKHHVTLSHMWNHLLPGRMSEFYDKTERFAQLISERGIPSMTMLETLEARFGAVGR